MNDRTVSLSCIAAVALWVVTFALIFTGTVVAIVDHRDLLPFALAFMAHGLACSAAAATVSIRYMFKKQNRFMRQAFDLGRDAGPVSVRSMR